MSCPFCTLPDIQERVIARNDLAFAFLTNIPIVEGHTLIVPVRCVGAFDELTPQEVQAIFDLRVVVRNALVKTFDAQGFHYLWNEGEVAGQHVAHVHMQVVPRKQGDAGIYTYEPKQYLYLPGRERPISAPEELHTTASLIQKNILWPTK